MHEEQVTQRRAVDMVTDEGSALLTLDVAVNAGNPRVPDA
jgi:hypothetical protein